MNNIKLDPWGKPIESQTGATALLRPSKLISGEDLSTYTGNELLEATEAHRAAEEAVTNEVQDGIIKEAEERVSTLTALSVNGLAAKAEEVNDQIEQLEIAIGELWTNNEAALNTLQRSQADSKDKYLKALSMSLETREAILKLDSARMELINDYFKDRAEIAQLEYARIKSKSKPSDLGPSDFAYINRILDQGDNAAIAAMLKKYKWHPDLLELISSVRKDLKLVHPLQLLSDPKFARGIIREHSGRYSALNLNFLDRIKRDEIQAVPAWAWPLPDQYENRDPWGKVVPEWPQEAVQRLKQSR